MFRLFVCYLKRSTLAASVAITAITATLAADGGRSVLVEDVPSQNFPRLISAVLAERKLGVANVNQATREVFSTYEEYDWNNVRCRSQWAFRYDAGAVTVTLQDREGKTASGWMKMTVLNAGAGPEEAMLRRMMERMKALNAQLAGTASPKAASGAPAPVASGAPPGRAPAAINRTSDSTYLERPPAVDNRDPGVDHAVALQIQMRHDVVCGEGLCAVYKDGSWGFIDRTGKLVIDFQYDQESLASGPPVFHGGLCAVKLKQPSPEVIYIDRKGGRQFPNLHLTRAGSFNAGLAVVEVMGRSGTAVIDVKGEILGTNPDSITNPLYYEEFVDGFSSGSKGYYDTHLRLAIPFSGLHKSFREGL